MIDLHTHTLYSDGTDTEIEILEAAQRAGLNTIAITDHNTAKVYEALEKVDVDQYFKGQIITGIELNTTMCNVPIEILGFGFDYKLMNEKIKEVYMPAEERNIIEARRLYEYLNNFLPMETGNIPIDSIVREFIGNGCFYR
jgi:predicted metal-dependent phosphoesterase TrpH